MVKELIKKGANVNKGNKTNKTPLYVASSRGNLEVVRELVIGGDANLRLASAKGTTPLGVAKIMGKNTIIKFLKETLSYQDEDPIDTTSIPSGDEIRKE